MVRRRVESHGLTFTEIEQANCMTPNELIGEPMSLTHVVLLGAGASRAAFPDGDGTGRQLPLMDDFVNVLGLHSFVEAIPANLVQVRNFEAIYSQLLSRPESAETVAALERRVEEYFEGMTLPEQVTIYDQLLLSLRLLFSFFHHRIFSFPFRLCRFSNLQTFLHFS